MAQGEACVVSVCKGGGEGTCARGPTSLLRLLLTPTPLAQERSQLEASAAAAVAAAESASASASAALRSKLEGRIAAITAALGQLAAQEEGRAAKRQELAAQVRRCVLLGPQVAGGGGGPRV